MEDLLEEIVGEIYDEFDRDLQLIAPQDDGSVVLPGSFPIHDLEDIEVEVPEVMTRPSPACCSGTWATSPSPVRR